MRRLCYQSQAGTSLTEVLVAMLILVSFVLPINKFRAYILTGGPSGKELAHTIAVALLEELGDQFYRTGSWPSSSLNEDEHWAVGHLFHRSWTVSTVGGEMGTGKAMLRRATVTVTCTDCVGANPTVEVVALLAKVPQ